jgi:hypothetical protein
LRRDKTDKKKRKTSKQKTPKVELNLSNCYNTLCRGHFQVPAAQEDGRLSKADHARLQADTQRRQRQLRRRLG